MESRVPWKGVVLPAMIVILRLCVAEFLITQADIPRYLLPRPSEVLAVFREDWPVLWDHFSVTLSEWAIGLAASVVVGCFAAWLAFESKLVSQFINPLMTLSQSIPYLTFAPLLIVWLGLGMLPKIVLVILTCAFPIALVTQQGLTQARSQYELLAGMLKFGRQKAFKEVYLPSALPSFFAGLKISVTYAFVSTVLAELIGSEAGLGTYMLRAQNSYRMDRVVACVTLVVLASILGSWFVDRMKERIVFWKLAP